MKGFGVKFYGPDAIPDAKQQKYILGLTPAVLHPHNILTSQHKPIPIFI